MKLSLKHKFIFLIFTAILIELFLVFFDVFNGNGKMELYIFICFEVSFLFLVSFFVIKGNHTGDSYTTPISIPLFLIITGIIFRITLIPSVPTTSPDVFRYIWEGKIVAHGVNPYQVPPDAQSLNQYHSQVWEKVGFKNMTSIYPPFAQVTFLMGYFLSGESPWGLKLLYLLCEIITLIVLRKLLILKEINPNYVILYAWLPIPIMEYFINMHIDVAGITFLILFLYNIEKGRINTSAIFYALSFLVKFIPIILFPLLLRKLGVRKLIPFTLIFIFVTLAFYMPFITNDMAVKNTLATYLLRWEFNGSVYNLIKFISNANLARIVCSISLIVSIIVISLRYKDFVKGTFGVLIAFVIFATTVYPWYLGWAAVVNPLINFYSILSLLLTSNFSNFTPLGKVWQEYWWVLVIEYLPFFTLIYFDLQGKIFNKKS